MHDPRPGDPSICFYCYAVSIFDDNLVLREPTAEEAKQLDEDENLQYAIAQLKSFKSMRKGL